MHVLLVEPHKSLVRVVRQALEEEGFTVDTAADSGDADFKIRSAQYDVIILDMMLPGKEGLGLLGEWRRQGIKAHVLGLIASEAPEERARVLDHGADACLTKPFELEELLARVRALLRRRGPVDERWLRVFDLEIDLTQRIVKRAGQVIRLTPPEFALLHLLATHRGKVVTRSMIWDHLYDMHDRGTSNVVDVYIRYLRTKIDKGFAPPLILTRWGEGYSLRDAPATSSS